MPGQRCCHPLRFTAKQFRCGNSRATPREGLRECSHQLIASGLVGVGRLHPRRPTPILCRLASPWSRSAADVLQRPQGSIAENPVTARRRQDSNQESRRVATEKHCAGKHFKDCRRIAVKNCRQTCLGRKTRSRERLRCNCFQKSGRQDSNLRPSAPKAPALPSCATPR